jgi:predicted solute-binding protein
VSKAVVVEAQKHVGVKVIQSLNASITTTKVETVIMVNTYVVKKEVLIRFPTKLGSGSGGILIIKNLIQSLALPIATTRVVGILQMVFTNLITITHVNKTTNQPLMSSMAMGNIVMTFLVRECYGSPKKQEF